MSEPLNKLKTDIKNEIEQQGYSLQSSFTKHVNEIIALKNDGVQYQFIHQKLELDISLSHFHNLLQRAKKKRTDTQSNATKENRVTPTLAASYDEKTKQKQTQHEVNPKIISHFSEADWKAIGINNDYLISVLLETDLSPDEVKSWNCPNQIQLSTRISEYRHRKMKRK